MSLLKSIPPLRKKKVKQAIMRTFITLLFISFLCIGKETDCMAQANTQDSLALVDLYNSTNGGSWYKNTGWLSGPVSGWYGISLTAGGNVNHIILDSNNLVGPLPPSLGNLSELTQLILYQNKLNGSIPASFGSLLKLTNLLLTSNRLSGSIPASLGNAGGLIQLDLRSNQLTGIIPPSLGNLSNLLVLTLNGNVGITGGIPDAIGNLTNLEVLDLGLDGSLGGSFPDTLRNLKQLQTLDLSNDNLTGSIPDWFPQLPALSYLNLQFNKICLLY